MSNIETSTYQDYFRDYYDLAVPESVIDSFVSHHVSYAFEMGDFLMTDFLAFIGVGMKYPSYSSSDETWERFNEKLATQCKLHNITQLD